MDSTFFLDFCSASHSHRIFGFGNPRDLKPLERCLQLHNTQTFSILVFKKSTHPMACLFHAFQLVRNSKHSRKNTQQTSSFTKKGLFWTTGGFCSILSEKLFRKNKKNGETTLAPDHSSMSRKGISVLPSKESWNQPSRKTLTSALVTSVAIEPQGGNQSQNLKVGVLRNT